MKFWREKLGCTVWTLAILALSVGAGLWTYNGLANIQWDIVSWLHIALSIIASIFVMIFLGVVSFITLIVTDKDYEKECPDFGGQV
jgi:hypothetical protein